MPKLKYRGLIDGATSKAVQVGHLDTLYFDLLMPAIDSLGKSDLTPDQDPLDLELGSAMVSWAQCEVCVLGFVSAFHMWERQFRELLIEQRSIQGLNIPARNRAESLVAYARRMFEDYFEITCLSTYWEELSRALAVVNALKHGQGPKFNAVLQEHPEYFYVPKESGHLPMVSISKSQLAQLMRSLEGFWGALPVEIDYRSYPVVPVDGLDSATPPRGCL